SIVQMPGGIPVATFAIGKPGAINAGPFAASVLALGLGFIWIAFDREKQGWHDKIAGTVVVRLPKGSSLV
ncbi:MAG TPA: AIR carboxylase family protein, partial [Opitutaceae bacterium]